MATLTLKEELYKIAKDKYSFRIGNVPKIINGTLQRVGEKSFITKDDIIETILNVEFNDILGSISKKDKLSYQLTNLMNKYKITNHNKSFNFDSISDERQKIINSIAKKMEKSGVKITNSFDFKYLAYQMILIINKNIKKETLERYNFFETEDGWTEKSDLVLGKSLFDNISDIVVDENKTDIESLKDTIVTNLLIKSTRTRELVEKILTEQYLENVLNVTFDGDLQKALKVINNEIDIIDDIKDHISNIHGMEGYIEDILFSMENNKEIVIITDDDNDGNSFLAALNEWKKTLKPDQANLIKAFPARFFSGSETSHGLNNVHIEYLIENGDINPDKTGLLLTVDNGMSLTEEHVNKITSHFPNLDRFRVTDHHLPSSGLAKETELFKITNPKFNPIDFFSNELNISGAQTGIEGLKEVSIRLNQDPNLNNTIEFLNEVIRFSNLADMVKTSLFYYPLKNLNKYSELSTLLNVSNNMKSIIGREIDYKPFASLLNISNEESVGILNEINRLNNIAKDFLNINKELFSNNDKIQSTTQVFESHFSDILSKVTDVGVSDDNYLSMLRPLMIQISAKDNASIHEIYFLKQLTNIFKNMIKIQKRIVLKIQENPNNFIEQDNGLKSEHIEVMIIKNKALNVGVGRKLLNIALNDINKGVRIILDSNKENKLGGSGRFLVSHKGIFTEEEATIQGHDFAAGVLFEFDGKNTKEKIKEIISIIEKKEPVVSELVENLKMEEVEFVFPTECVHILQDIDNLVKGRLHKSYSLPQTFYLNKYEIETLKRKLVDLKSDKYGYIKLDTKIMSHSLIMSIGVLKKYIEETEKGKKIGIAFSSLSDDAGIVSKLIDIENSEIIEPDRELEKDFQNYLDTKYKKNKEILPNSALELSAFFKYNKNGKTSFRKVEAVIINIIHDLKLSTYNILDVEANGLDQQSEYENKSDKDAQLAEVGNVALKIDPKSGIKISIQEYKLNSFLTIGKEVFVTKKEQEDFVKLTKEEIEEIKNPTIDSKYDINFIIENKETGEVFYNNEKTYFKEIYSSTIIGEEVIFNQELIGDNTHYFIKDLNDYLDTAIESLIHLSNDFIIKNGTMIKKIDRDVSNMFKKQGKFLLSAHNAMYDLKKIKFFLPKTWEVIKELAVVMDSAKSSQSARSEGQQFAAINLEVPIGDMNPKVHFKDYRGNNLSLTEFIDSKKNQSELLSYNKLYVLKFIDNSLIFIDKKKNLSIPLVKNISNMSNQEIEEKLNLEFDTSVSPKYSVESLNSQMMIQMMLQGLSVRKEDRNFSDLTILPLFDLEFKELLSSYRFELNYKQNISNFLRLVSDNFKEKNGVTKSGEEVIKDILSSSIKESYKKEYGFEPSKTELKKLLTSEYDNYMFEMHNNIDTFINNNKDISAIFTNRFHFEDVIHYLPNDLKFINDNLIKAIAHKTSQPIEMVKNVVELVKDFEKLNGINVYKISEIHNNIVATITEIMGDAPMEGLLVLTHLINEKYNPLSKRKLIDEVTSFSKLTILKSSPMVYKIDFKEDFLKRTRGEKSVLKVDTKFFPADTVIYANVDGLEKSKIKEIVDNIETHGFLRNLNNGKKSILNNVFNQIEDNKSNFKQLFSMKFMLKDLDLEIEDASISFDFYNSYDLKIADLSNKIKILREEIFDDPSEEIEILEEISELELLKNKISNINEKIRNNIDLNKQENIDVKSFYNYTNIEIVQENLELEIFSIENRVDDLNSLNKFINNKFKDEKAEIDNMSEKIEDDKNKLSVIESIIEFHSVSLDLKELKKELKKETNVENVQILEEHISVLEDSLKEIKRLRTKYTPEEKALEVSIKDIIKLEKIKTVEGIENLFLITENISESLNDFQKLTEQKNSISKIIDNETTVFDDLYSSFQDKMLKEKEGMVITSKENVEFIEDTSSIEQHLSYLKHLNKSLNSIYAKSQDLDITDKLLLELNQVISIPEDELISKYGIDFDYSSLNKEIKIIDDLNELLFELFELNDENSNRTSLSSKYMDRIAKTNELSYIPELELESFKNNITSHMFKILDQVQLKDNESETRQHRIQKFLSKYSENNAKFLNDYYDALSNEIQGSMNETLVLANLTKLNKVFKLSKPGIMEIKKEIKSGINVSQIINKTLERMEEVKSSILMSNNSKMDELIVTSGDVDLEKKMKVIEENVLLSSVIGEQFLEFEEAKVVLDLDHTLNYKTKIGKQLDFLLDSYFHTTLDNESISLARSLDGNTKKVNDPSKSISEMFSPLLRMSQHVQPEELNILNYNFESVQKKINEKLKNKDTSLKVDPTKPPTV